MISSDQARLNRADGAIQSLGQQVAAAQFQTFLDPRELGNFRTAAANRRAELEGFPVEVPEVAAALGALADVEKQIEARVAEEFAAQRRRAANEAAYREMRARYDVVIETPAPPVERE